MDRVESALVEGLIAIVLALVLLPLHLFVAPHVPIVGSLCLIGWLVVAWAVGLALRDLHRAWWIRSVVRDYRLQHDREVVRPSCGC